MIIAQMELLRILSTSMTLISFLSIDITTKTKQHFIFSRSAKLSTKVQAKKHKIYFFFAKIIFEKWNTNSTNKITIAIEL